MHTSDNISVELLHVDDLLQVHMRDKDIEPRRKKSNDSAIFLDLTAPRDKESNPKCHRAMKADDAYGTYIKETFSS